MGPATGRQAANLLLAEQQPEGAEPGDHDEHQLEQRRRRKARHRGGGGAPVTTGTAQSRRIDMSTALFGSDAP
jgi:hypothetical protein